MDINQTVQELYSLPPEAFTAARNAREREAKASGDTQLATVIHQLRKPSTVAWLVNQLVREHPDEIRSFLDLGEALREATARLSGVQLRELGKQRRQRVNALLKQAGELANAAGHKVSPDAAREVENTLHAALADEGAADRLSAGCLIDTLDGAGFPLAGSAIPEEPVTHSPSAGTAKDESSTPRPASQRVRAEREEQHARAAVQEAEESQMQMKATVERTTTAVQEVTAVVGGLRASLEQAQVELTRREKEHHQAQADLENAVRAARQAAQRLAEIAQRTEDRSASS